MTAFRKLTEVTEITREITTEVLKTVYVFRGSVSPSSGIITMKLKSLRLIYGEGIKWKESVHGCIAERQSLMMQVHWTINYSTSEIWQETGAMRLSGKQRSMKPDDKGADIIQAVNRVPGKAGDGFCKNQVVFFCRHFRIILRNSGRFLAEVPVIPSSVRVNDF